MFLFMARGLEVEVGKLQSQVERIAKSTTLKAHGLPSASHVELHLRAFVQAFGSAFTPEHGAVPPPLTLRAAANRGQPTGGKAPMAEKVKPGVIPAVAGAARASDGPLAVGDRVRVRLPSGRSQPQYGSSNYISSCFVSI
jgi:hypothetical protein